ncbi:NfeD family protein [Aerosakkonemataceae cyanobacterium BLCC-F50]|uniref:NfeD family protein n=1 Tax=Floridaenema flaviceps BLCC-F50 TaxID=3153642 RepID=A0ABV4XTD8_9CYAN
MTKSTERLLKTFINIIKSFQSVEAEKPGINTSRKLPLNSSFSYPEEEAIVDVAIYPYKRGRVYFRGSWWFAQCERKIILLPGQMVHVVGINNITLLVEPFVSTF